MCACVCVFVRMCVRVCVCACVCVRACDREKRGSKFWVGLWADKLSGMGAIKIRAERQKQKQNNPKQKFMFKNIATEYSLHVKFNRNEKVSYA